MFEALMDSLDVTTIGVFVVSFAVCAALVAGVSVFGARERTFEEALEDQKRRLKKEKAVKKAAKAEHASVNANVKRRQKAAKDVNKVKGWQLKRWWSCNLY